MNKLISCECAPEKQFTYNYRYRHYLTKKHMHYEMLLNHLYNNNIMRETPKKKKTSTILSFD